MPAKQTSLNLEREQILKKLAWRNMNNPESSLLHLRVGRLRSIKTEGTRIKNVTVRKGQEGQELEKYLIYADGDLNRRIVQKISH